MFCTVDQSVGPGLTDGLNSSAEKRASLLTFHNINYYITITTQFQVITLKYLVTKPEVRLYLSPVTPPSVIQ